MSLKKLRKATTDMEVDKRKALKLALEKIEKDYGRGSIMRLGDFAKQQKDISAISTGSLGLDIALGIGGLPRAVGWWKSTAPNLRAKPPSPCK